MNLRKIGFLAVLFFFLFVLVACEPNEPPVPPTEAEIQAADFREQVDSLGTISLNSLANLQTLKAAYAVLPDNIKALVQDAYAKLVVADHTYFGLLINSYGTVDLADKSGIDAALNYYNTQLLSRDTAITLKQTLDGHIATWQALVDAQLAVYSAAVAEIPTTNLTGATLDLALQKVNDAIESYSGLHVVVLPYSTNIKATFDQKATAVNLAVTAEINAFDQLVNALPSSFTGSGEAIDDLHQELLSVQASLDALSAYNRAGAAFNYNARFNALIQPALDLEKEAMDAALVTLTESVSDGKVVSAFLAITAATEHASNYSELFLSGLGEEILDFIDAQKDKVFNGIHAELLAYMETLEAIPDLTSNILDAEAAYLYVFEGILATYPEITDLHANLVPVIDDLRSMLDNFGLLEAQELFDYVLELPETVDAYNEEEIAVVENKLADFKTNYSNHAYSLEAVASAIAAVEVHLFNLKNFVDEVILTHEVIYETLNTTTSEWSGKVVVKAVVYAPNGDILTVVVPTSTEGTFILVDDYFILEVPFTNAPAPETTATPENSFLVTFGQPLITSTYENTIEVITGGKTNEVVISAKTPVDPVSGFTFNEGNNTFTYGANHVPMSYLVTVYYNNEVFSTFDIRVNNLSFTVSRLRREFAKLDMVDASGYTIDFSIQRVSSHEAFANSIPYVYSGLVIYPTVADLIRPVAATGVINIAANKALELNRIAALFDFLDPGVEFVRVYVFDSNEGSPSAENALDYFDIYVEIENIAAETLNGKYNLYTIIDGQKFTFLDMYGWNNIYVEGVTSYQMIQKLLGEDYDEFQQYWIANQVFVIADEESIYDLNGLISPYSTNFLQEQIPVVPQERPDVSNLFGYSQGNGFTPMEFDRFAPMRINSVHLDHVLIRIYATSDANKDTDSIGEFKFYYDGAGRILAGSTTYTLAGGVGNFWLDATAVKNVMTAALGEAYNPTQSYYFSNQLIISETTDAFEQDSLISEIHSNFWREQAPVVPQQRPDVSSMYAFSEGSGFSNFAFDRYEPMRISSIHIDHIIVRIYTSAAANKDTESIGEFIFYYDGAGRVNAGGTIFNLAGGIGGYYLFAAPFKDVMVAALGEAYNPSQAYYFSAQIIISETTEAFEEDSLISALHPNFWRELN